MNTAPALHMIGLALRGGNAVVGEEPVESEIRAGHVRLLLVASDAAGNTCRRADHFAQAGHCLLLPFPADRGELGRAVGRTAAALVAITDLGLAAAIVKRLAQENPSYSTLAEKLELKQQRAAERRTDAYKEARAQRAAQAPAPVPEEKERKPRFRTAHGVHGEQDGRSFRSRTADEQTGRPFRKERSADGQRGERSFRPSEKSHGSRSGRNGQDSRRNPYANSRPVHFGKGSKPRRRSPGQTG